MGGTTKRLRVFLSYSHRDEDLQQALNAHLATLKRSGLIEVWWDRKLTGGREVDPEIAANLERADLILLLISADFLNSEYCSSVELNAAMARHDRGTTRVLPIILRPCDWQGSAFGNLLVAPKDGKAITDWRSRDKALMDVVQTIRGIVTELGQSTASNGATSLGSPGAGREPATEGVESEPITMHSVEWLVQIHVISGASASVWKSSTLTANEPNITTLVDRNFGSTGDLAFVSSSLGEISGPIDEGGSLAVTTVLPEPLLVGQRVTNILEIKATDTFTASKETFSHLATDRCPCTRILVQLPRSGRQHQRRFFKYSGVEGCRCRTES